MNEFVDYQKRDVELPPGCKDLIDVLHLARRTQTPAGESVKTVTDLESYISRVVSSPAGFRALWVYPDATSVLAVFCGKHGLRVLVVVDALREEAVRGIFARAGLAPLQDFSLQDNARGIQVALTSASGIGLFVRDLLTLGFGVTQESPLEYRFYERKAA